MRPRADEDARRAGPVRRVGAEAVQEDDGPLGRERPSTQTDRREPSSAAKTSRWPPEIASHSSITARYAGNGSTASAPKRKKKEKAIAPSTQLHLLIASGRYQILRSASAAAVRPTPLGASLTPF